MVADGPISRKSTGTLAIILLCGADLCGFYVCYIHSSWLLLGLGVFGGLAERGLGELFIAICYGWLTLFTGFATANSTFPPYGDIFAKLRDRSLLKGACGDSANGYICGGCRGKAYAATSDPLDEDPTCYIHHTEKPEYLKWMNTSD